MGRDIEFSKWIEVSIGISVSSNVLLKTKEYMKRFANELDWKMEVDKKGFVSKKGLRLYTITIRPSSRLLSPEELRQKIDLLEGFSSNILTELPINDDETGKCSYSISLMSDEDVLVSLGGVLNLKAKMKDFAELERKHPNLSEVIFTITLKRWREGLLRRKNSLKFFFKKQHPEKKFYELLIEKIDKSLEYG